MSSSSNRFICIHGHFNYFQPGIFSWRLIEVQDSAHPYHDWNERINAECYYPNTASRILDQDSVIKNITNNYSKISFNFGPTLLSWMQLNATETYEAILEADKESIQHFGGHGSAMAQVYNHIIMPLANERDKETQVIWGIRDFEKRFKRKPEGMWLAETAVDYSTLEVLAANDIKFTVLAPRQAKAVRKVGEDNWNEVNDTTVNTRKAYLCKLPSGRAITLFFYEGNISHLIAFNGLLNDGKRFAESLTNAINNDDDEPQLVNVATDGETYGHHHKHGEMALAFCLDYMEKDKQVNLINYAQFLEKFPASYEAQIIENSSWSCVHGVERWRSDCGCNGGKPGFHQRWRKPLREALDWLRDSVEKLFELEGEKVLREPWTARNEYINIVLDRSDETIQKFLTERTLPDASENRILRLLEMQRHAMLMYTSCGWFFDELSGIETTQVMQYACRVVQLASQIGGTDLGAEFVSRLKKAPSNTHENGAVIYKTHVIPARTNLKRVGMHFAVSSIFEEEPEALTIFNYSTSNEIFIKKEAGEQKLVLSITKVKSIVTKSEKKFAFAVIYLGQHNIIGNISLDMEPDKFASMQVKMVKAFEEGRLGDVIGTMQQYFGPEKYTIWQMFADEKRKILNMIAQKSLSELVSSLRRTYASDYPLINALANNNIPIPNAYRTTFVYILNADLVNCFQLEKINTKEMDRISVELARWNLKVEDLEKISHLANDSIYAEIKRIGNDLGNVKRLIRLNRVFPLLEKLNLLPDLYKSQNLYFEISTENKDKAQINLAEWQEKFILLGDNLGVKVE